jgi:hypothetical protein
MSLNGFIKATIASANTVSDIVARLIEHGWSGLDNNYFFSIGDSFSVDNSWQTIPRESLTLFLEGIDYQWGIGKVIMTTLYWMSPNVRIDICFEGNTLLFLFDGSRPIIERCHRFTDYTWLIQHLICPMVQSGIEIERLECVDEL